MTPTGINHVSVVARDLEQSVAFYRDTFGLEQIPTPNFGHPVQWLRLGDQQLHAFERSSDAPVYNHLVINVPNFGEVYRKAQSQDIFDAVTFGHHIFELPNHEVQMYVRDPAGNLVEVDWPDIASLDESIAGEAKNSPIVSPRPNRTGAQPCSAQEWRNSRHEEPEEPPVRLDRGLTD